MVQKVYPMTKAGYHALQESLKTLKQNDRPSIIRAIAEARSHGDLSENAEYAAAKERQKQIEGRIADIEIRLANAQVVAPTEVNHSVVAFGARVTLHDNDLNRTLHYQIVGENEANVSKGQLSITSPIAKGLLMKAKGDVATINTPGGERHYTIQHICYQQPSDN